MGYGNLVPKMGSWGGSGGYTGFKGGQYAATGGSTLSGVGGLRLALQQALHSNFWLEERVE